MKMSEPDIDRQTIERLTDVVPPPSFEVSKKAGAPKLNALTKRDVAILTAWDSHQNYEAMAAALGRPLGTIKSRLSRARARKARLHPEAL